MSSLVLSGDTSGTVTVSVPAVAGTNTATLPAATGTVMVSGNMPAFSVYLGTNQSLSSLTNTKVQLNTENFDTNNNYDPVTNYRFTPTVAGYYQISFSIYLNSAFSYLTGKLYKNASVIAWADVYGGSSLTPTAMGSVLTYMNGSTDYIELYAFTNGANTILARSDLTWMTGTMVRSA
jgi:hypothetical protein